MTLKTMEPGWLQRTVDQNARLLRLSYTPQRLIAIGLNVELPLPEVEVDALYAGLDKQFYAWTGRHLKDHQR